MQAVCAGARDVPEPLLERGNRGSPGWGMRGMMALSMREVAEAFAALEKNSRRTTLVASSWGISGSGGNRGDGTPRLPLCQGA